jgi:hypothetical protein
VPENKETLKGLPLSSPTPSLSPTGLERVTGGIRDMPSVQNCQNLGLLWRNKDWAECAEPRILEGAFARAVTMGWHSGWRELFS